MLRVARACAALATAGFGCAVYVYVTLPDVRPLGTSNPASTAFIELRARESRSKGLEPRRVQHWVTFARISPQLTRAVLVAEDARFWQHDGVDLVQLRESIEVNIERRELARGGSTVTQQLAKNLYLSPSKNPLRKLRELLIARRLEAELTKPRILELYLNVVEWGDGIYGAEAAARTYFGKPASGLDARESALLAAALVNPRVLTPGRPTARLRQRQQLILRRMGAAPPSANVARQAPAAAPEEPASAPIRPVPELRPAAAPVADR